MALRVKNISQDTLDAVASLVALTLERNRSIHDLYPPVRFDSVVGRLCHIHIYDICNLALKLSIFKECPCNLFESASVDYQHPLSHLLFSIPLI